MPWIGPSKKSARKEVYKIFFSDQDIDMIKKNHTIFEKMLLELEVEPQKNILFYDKIDQEVPLLIYNVQFDPSRLWVLQ
jgi:hypothetical protein